MRTVRCAAAHNSTPHRAIPHFTAVEKSMKGVRGSLRSAAHTTARSAPGAPPPEARSGTRSNQKAPRSVNVFKKLIDRDEPIALSHQLRQRGAQRLHGLAAIATTIVHQDDIARLRVHDLR